MPIPTLQIHYSGRLVGVAKVDEELTPLVTLPINLDFPKRTRRALTRPDLRLAALQSDDGLLSQCHPFYQLGDRTRLVLRLSHIAVRPEVVPLVLRFTKAEGQEQEEIKQRILEITYTVDRVVFLNRDRTDCRRINLREITRLSGSSPDESTL